MRERGALPLSYYRTRYPAEEMLLEFFLRTWREGAEYENELSNLKQTQISPYSVPQEI